jgi:hypothetical protein
MSPKSAAPGLLCLLFAATLRAQTPTATLVGRIVDPSGSGVPGATIRVNDPETNQTRITQSQVDGSYTISNLPPGRYEATIDKTGFRRLVENKLELRVDQTARLDAQLEIGSTGQSIVVEASVPLLNTENASRGDVIVNHEMTQMPLNGRDFTDLAFMVAGVGPSEQSAKGGPMSINGVRADGSNVLIDGLNDQNPRDAGAQVSPPLDSLQEFKMQTSGYSAEYGRLAGGVMNMVLKSGGNQVHASVFEFLRNDLFDARNFFDATKGKLRRNQFGGTLTGPVVIPKLYNGHNRTFLLASWESYRQRQGQTQVDTVPTALEHHGDFSKSVDSNGKPVTLKDPLGGNFAGNVIPASRLSSVALKILPYFPQPTLPGQVNNYITAAPVPDSWDNFLFKVDQKVSDKDNVSFRALQRWSSSTNPFSGSNLGTFPSNTDTSQKLASITYTRVFSASLVNEARAGLTRTTSLQQGGFIGHDYARDFGITGLTTDPKVVGFPRIQVSGLETLGDSNSTPITYLINNYDASNTLTWIKGNHTIRFGGEIVRTQFFQPTNTDFRGTFSFKGKWTNSATGDFLLGLLDTSTRRVGSAWNYIFETQFSAFVQDDYKIAHNLTLNIGLRYDVLQPPSEKYGQIASYVPSLGKIILGSAVTIPNWQATVANAGLNGLVALASDVGLPPSLAYGNYDDFAPRIGLAWRPFGDNRTVLRTGYGIFYTGSRLNPVRTDLTGGFPFASSQTFTKTNNPGDLTYSNAYPDALAKAQGINATTGYEVNAPSQYLQSWNFTIEREIGRGVGVEVGYTGSKGTHLGRKYDIDQAVRKSGAALPDGSYPRPIPGFSDVEYYSFSQNSSYNAATISVLKRLDHGIFFRVNYTCGKSLDTASGLNYAGAGGYAGAQDQHNLLAERGRSDFDVRHNFSMNFTYQVPFHNLIVRGWQLSGTGRAYSGQPFTPSMKSTSQLLGEPTRPDRVANGSLANPTPLGWFNVAAFPIVPDSAFRFGNSGRNILDGPGFMAFNLALSKQFTIAERARAQFRWETFNFTNRANFNLPNKQVDTLGAGTITGAGASRVMQLGLRVEF